MYKPTPQKKFGKFCRLFPPQQTFSTLQTHFPLSFWSCCWFVQCELKGAQSFCFFLCYSFCARIDFSSYLDTAQGGTARRNSKSQGKTKKTLASCAPLCLWYRNIIHVFLLFFHEFLSIWNACSVLFHLRLHANFCACCWNPLKTH